MGSGVLYIPLAHYDIFHQILLEFGWFDKDVVGPVQWVPVPVVCCWYIVQLGCYMGDCGRLCGIVSSEQFLPTWDPSTPLVLRVGQLRVFFPFQFSVSCILHRSSLTDLAQPVDRQRLALTSPPTVVGLLEAFSNDSITYKTWGLMPSGYPPFLWTRLMVTMVTGPWTSPS